MLFRKTDFNRILIYYLTPSAKICTLFLSRVYTYIFQELFLLWFPYRKKFKNTKNITVEPTVRLLSVVWEWTVEERSVEERSTAS